MLVEQHNKFDCISANWLIWKNLLQESEKNHSGAQKISIKNSKVNILSETFVINTLIKFNNIGKYSSDNF